MLTKDEFLLLSTTEKISLVFEAGNEVISRIYLFYHIKLYVLSDFFVEIWYQKNSNTIDRVIVVDAQNVFELYENQINISDLFQ